MKLADASSLTAAETRRLWLADLSMVAVALIWGLNMPIMKLALSRVDPYLFNAVRLAVSALVLWLVVRFGNRFTTPSDRIGWSNGKLVLMVVLFGLFNGFAYQVLFLIGINKTTAGNTALIMSAIPIWTSILGFFMIGERLNRMALVGLVAAMVGAAIVTASVPDGDARSGSLMGNLIVSAAAFSWALATVISRPIMRQVSPTALALYAIVISLPFHFLICYPTWGQMWLFFQDRWLLGCLFYSGALSTGVAYALWNFGVQILGTSHAAIFQNLVPFIALIASWLLIEEIPLTLQIIGGLVIVAGVVIVRKNRTG